MDSKRMILAVAIVFVALVAAGFLIHAIWLGPIYQALREGGFSYRAPDALQHRLGLIWFGDLLYAIFFVWVYNRGCEEKPWVGQGLRYGVMMTLFTIVPSSLTEYAVYSLPHMLVIKWMVAEGVVLVIVGLLVAGLCQKKAA
jgi:hypothetical protein